MVLTKAVFLIAAFAGVLLGDQPPAKPEKKTYKSPHGKYVAVSDPASTLTSVFAGENLRKSLWTLPGWHAVLFISDDGVVIVGYPGSNLLAKDYKPTDTLLSFYKNGQLTKAIQIKDLIDPKQLRETTSHYSWGSFLGFEKGKFLVELNDGHRIAFIPATGERAAH